MIILLSPSKSFQLKGRFDGTTPYFLTKANTLRNQLKLLSTEQIIHYFKVSNKQADLIHHYFNSTIQIRAIDLYQGIQFKALNASLLSSTQAIYIISALYGLLRASDLISPYRLDLNQSYFKHLDDFWQDDINDYLNTHHQGELIVNLCSNEFRKMIQYPTLTIDFYENNKKVGSPLIKQLRGLMAHHLIQHNITSIPDIKSINLEGFTFDEERSNDQHFTFKRG